MRKLTIRKVLNKIVCVSLRNRGFVGYGITELSERIVKDLLDNKQETMKEKWWAFKRGFLSHNVKDYGLTNDNYKSFISDFDYYTLYPINTKFRHWIDDKMTVKYMLAPFKDYMPKYYYHIIKPGQIQRLMDITDDSVSNVQAILELLKKEGNLAVKLVAGEKGQGFYKISYLDHQFFVNGSKLNEESLVAFLDKLENYIVTEYLTAHPQIRKFYSFSSNTLRVMVINEDGENPYVANAMMRIGTTETGSIESVTTCGIFTIVDIADGRFHSAKKFENHHATRCEIHPDTDIEIEGFLPCWDEIKAKLIEISKYLCELPYLGFDVVMTEEGFKILEINSMQGINFYQYYYPLGEGNPASSFFRKQILSKKKV
jgi:hypothetical protein